MDVSLYIPAIEHMRGRLLGSPVQRLRAPAREVRGSVADFKKGVVKGFTFTPADSDSAAFVILPKISSARNLGSDVLVTPDGLPTNADAADACRWLYPKAKALHKTAAKGEAEVVEVRESWTDRFSYRIESRRDGKVIRRGLRAPQIGALKAVQSHWTVSEEPATVVMPTGTGKTETMLALLVAEQLDRVLVIVPTDALREQIGKKFLTLGILKAAGVLAADALLPVVGTLLHKPRTVKEAEDLFRRCNVIVTTASIAGDCTNPVASAIASMCSHLFVDEAHHVRAPSWERVRTCFTGKRVVQFTATPYRGDGKLVDGKVVYNYPLRKAQAEGYFQPIRFKGIEEYNDDKSDDAIATAAIAQLDADLKAGHDHLLMARCASIKRAEEIFDLYDALGSEHKPVLAHSELTVEKKRDPVRRMRSRESRIVVCVDMFGEGFDLPELKVAALHDVHKSLAVTLQFTGRFTRTNANVGDATVIANIADADVDEALQALYGEDPDWNYLLRDLSEQASGNHVARSEFVRGFTQFPEHIPLQNVFPKMSTVVYETKCAKWKPERAAGALKHLYDTPAMHAKQRVVMLVTKEFEPVQWGDIRGISDTVYHLYLLHWDDVTKLLYIHSSNTDSLYEGLAKAVCGDDVAIMRGERVFRVLGGVNRLILMNLGLGHSLSRAVRFTMHVGADIREGLSEAHAQNKYKTNIFGRGYEGGNKATVGCSAKGRVWSHRVAGDIGEWVGWCHEVGKKLLNPQIDVTDILKGAMIPETIRDRPSKVPLTIEWSDDLLDRSEEAVKFELAGVPVPFYEVGLELTEHQDAGPIRFRVFSDSWPGESVEYEVKFDADRVDYLPLKSVEVSVAMGRRKRPLSEYLQAEPPLIRFHDGSLLIYVNLFAPPGKRPAAYDRNRIEVWDWTGVDLRQESQKKEKRPKSIQRRVITTLLAATGKERFDVVFDDDESGESADVVAIRTEKDRLLFRLYHCKFAKHGTIGARVEDLYAVCGQAQSSVHWKGRVEGFLDHLTRREAKRITKGRHSRFDQGDLKTLKLMKRKLRTLRAEFEIVIVQPGLSRAAAGDDHLELLAVTELHLRETYNIPFLAITSA